MKRLPKTIYVYQQKDADGGYYLVASAKPLGDEGEVGMYELKQVVALRQQMQIRPKGTRQWKEFGT